MTTRVQEGGRFDAIAPRSRAQKDRLFYTGMSLFVAATVFGGFAPIMQAPLWLAFAHAVSAIAGPH